MAHLRVACLGGSFNPIHYGHVALAKSLLANHGFDQVWFVLAKQAPLKETNSTSYAHRLAMIHRMIASLDNMHVCTIEQDLPTPSYTVDTIKALTAIYPHQFAWVIGSDQYRQFHLWKDASSLLEQLPFYVVVRDQDEDIQAPFHKVEAVSTTSSTAIRHGQSNDTDPKVLAYMILHHLYDASILDHHLSSKRKNHTISVMHTAIDISQHVDIDKDALVVACMFHDVAKEWDRTRTLEWITKDKVDAHTLAEYEYHAYAAASFMKHYYHVCDASIIHAIQTHTTGDTTELLAKVLFVADKIEPTRNYDTSELLNLARLDIHKAFDTIKRAHQAFNTSQGGIQ